MGGGRAGDRQLAQPERAVDKAAALTFRPHANRDLSREQSDRDRIRLRFSDESLPSRPFPISERTIRSLCSTFQAHKRLCFDASSSSSKS